MKILVSTSCHLSPPLIMAAIRSDWISELSVNWRSCAPPSKFRPPFQVYGYRIENAINHSSISSIPNRKDFARDRLRRTRKESRKERSTLPLRHPPVAQFFKAIIAASLFGSARAIDAVITVKDFLLCLWIQFLLVAAIAAIILIMISYAIRTQS